MDFSLNEDQVLLRDSIAKYIANDYAFAERQRIASEAYGFCPNHWSAFAEFGWLTVPFAEDVGGFGGSIEDTAILMEAFGTGLVLEPYLANVLLAGQIIARSNSTSIIENELAPMMAGRRQLALAAHERQARQNLADVATSASANSDGYLINGAKVLVINGAAADTLVVSARTSGTQLERDGISLFAVDATTAGIRRNPIALMDGTQAANIEFENVQVTGAALLGEADSGWSLLEPVVREARIAIGAQSLGIMDELFKKTLEYVKTRKQFGVAIGSFQALQHRLVDMFMAAQQARSAVYRAICEHQQDDANAASTIAAMKVLVGRYGEQIGTEAIQMHGGMGMTDELDIGHYVKSGMMLNQWFGSSDECLEEFAALAYPLD